MDITFAALHDALQRAGLDVGVELADGVHRIVVSDPAAPRWLQLTVDGDFDRTARMVVLSLALRESCIPAAARMRELSTGGNIVMGSWPELSALAMAASRPSEEA